MTIETTAREKLRSALEDSRGKLMDAIDGIPEPEMTKPAFGDWSVKDLLAHLSHWDETGWLDFPRLARGQVPFLAAYNNEEVDEWNAFLMRGRRLFPLEQVREELDDRRVRVLDSLATHPEKGLEEGQLARSFCDIIAQHEAMHAEAICEWRKQKGL